MGRLFSHPTETSPRSGSRLALLRAGEGESRFVSAHRRKQVFIAVGFVALAFNLRPVAVSVGPVLGDIRAGLSMNATTAGLVTTLPVLSFAAFGALAPWCARVMGVHRVMLASLLLAAAGMGLRATAGSPGLFIAATIPSLAGMATANVLLPSLVKLHFPARIGTLTSLYTTALAVGLTSAAMVTAPIAQLSGSWRDGLMVWALTALLAALPWLGLIRHDVKPESTTHATFPTRSLVRSPLAWTMAIFFGSQSLQAYVVFGWLPQIFRDAGFSAETAGLLVGVTAAVSIPISFALPAYAGRRKDLSPLIVGLCSCYIVGYVGLIIWPVAGAWLWAVLIGVGTGIFPLVLTMIGLRSRTPDGTAALSGFTQSVGYLVAGVGPFGVGLSYDLIGGWNVQLTFLALLVIPQMIAGLLVAKPRFVEDELGLSKIHPVRN